MHPLLQPVFEQTVTRLRGDDRVLAAYHSGSIGTPYEDRFSDVDPVFVIAADAFADVDRDLCALFAALGAEPVLMWPERNNGDTWKNYAVFFERDGALLQYDINIQAAPATGVVTPRGAVLFDKAGVLGPPAPVTANLTPERLTWLVEMYWIYIYIHAKYLLRGDRAKLLAAQQELFHVHLQVLAARFDDIEPGWWPLRLKQLGRRVDTTALYDYFHDGSAGTVRQRLWGQIQAFATDARAACAAGAATYPEDFEQRVRRHLDEVGIATTR